MAEDMVRSKKIFGETILSLSTTIKFLRPGNSVRKDLNRFNRLFNTLWDLLIR